MAIIIMNEFLTVPNIAPTIYTLLRYILFPGQNGTSLLIVHLHIGVIGYIWCMEKILM